MYPSTIEFLRHIQSECEYLIKEYNSSSYEEFTSNERLSKAICRSLEIIGEAVKHLPDAIRERYPKVEWRKLAGLRDVVAHAYFGIHDEIIWDVIRSKIPALLVEVSSIIEQEKEA